MKKTAYILWALTMVCLVCIAAGFGGAGGYSSSGGGNGISAVVQDTSPQLGGDLDGQGYGGTNFGELRGTNGYFAGSVTAGTVIVTSLSLVNVIGTGYLQIGPTNGMYSELGKGDGWCADTLEVKTNLYINKATAPVSSGALFTLAQNSMNIYLPTHGTSFPVALFGVGRTSINENNFDRDFWVGGDVHDYLIHCQGTSGNEVTSIGSTTGGVYATDYGDLFVLDTLEVKTNVYIDAFLDLAEMTAPGASVTNRVRIYVDAADGDLKAVDDNGEVITIADFTND